MLCINILNLGRNAPFKLFFNSIGYVARYKNSMLLVKSLIATELKVANFGQGKGESLAIRTTIDTNLQRWSPRGQILKSLALRPQVLENWPVLGSRTAVFFELLKFCGALEKFFRKRFFVEIA